MFALFEVLIVLAIYVAAKAVVVLYLTAAELILRYAERSAENRDNLISCIDFIAEMAPNISSVSILGILIFMIEGKQEQSISILTAAFFLGIVMKRYSRVLRKKFLETIEKDLK